MLKLWTEGTSPERMVMRAWAPDIPVPVGLTAQATHTREWGDGARKATERERSLCVLNLIYLYIKSEVERD